MKRLFDIVASGCGLIVLSPLFLILAIWIKLDSKGPVFYRQVRVGRNNKDFRIFKFRNENELMEKAADPEDYYIHVIMQEKIKLYLDYVKNSSFWYDIKLIFETFKVIITER